MFNKLRWTGQNTPKKMVLYVLFIATDAKENTYKN